MAIQPKEGGILSVGMEDNGGGEGLGFAENFELGTTIAGTLEKLEGPKLLSRPVVCGVAIKSDDNRGIVATGREGS